jgi:sialate O-acetylesterase
LAKRALLPLLLSVGWLTAAAEPRLPHLFSDHLVLQRDREIHVWGSADPGEKITVTVAADTASAQTDPAGQWSVRLPAMPAGGPFVLRVAGAKTLEVKDVMIGEVWIASGQSNMTFELSGSVGAEMELPRADYPDIRLFTVPKKPAASAQADTLPASWQLCMPATARSFSAVAYYFARDLYQKLHVPIGIIESAWPGTAIEEWIPPAAAVRDPQLQPWIDDWNRHEKGFTGARQPFSLEFDDFELIAEPGSQTKPLLLSNFDDGGARTPWGGTWLYSFADSPETSFVLTAPGRGGQGYAAHVAGRIDASDDARLRIRLQPGGDPMDLSAYAGIRFWVRGDGAFRVSSLQPTISDWDDYSSAMLHAFADWTQVTIWFRDLHQDGWGVTEEFTPNALTGFVIDCTPASGYPVRGASGLYQGMIAPLMSFPFRGAIWYQGEGNALRAAQYRKLLPALIEGWREASHQPDMQFLIVQLPNHGSIPTEPSESAWAELREAQFLTAKNIPGTGLAVAIDVGDPKDLHPHRKAEVGQRLALWALGTTYHQSIAYSGPLYSGMSAEGNAIRIHFTHIDGGLVAKNGALKGFAIAGEDHKFHWADARVDGDSVIVSSPAVSVPVAVRYAWGDSPECNLFNAAGLPASPFRTDDWARSPAK